MRRPDVTQISEVEGAWNRNTPNLTPSQHNIVLYCQAVSVTDVIDADLPDCFESFLGSADLRYFGSGYRRTLHKLSTAESRPDGCLRATASVTYAPNWSTRRGQVRLPHLSSIDVVVLSAWMGQILLETLGLTPDQIRKAWIGRFSVRTGPRPVEILDDVPATAQVIGVSAVDAATQCSEVRIRVGNFIGRLSIVHANPLRGQVGRRHADADGYAPAIYTDLYRYTKHRAVEVHLSTDGSKLRCLASLEMRASVPTGLSGHYWPMPTLIDCVVIGGQMAEVLIYSKRGLDRASSSGMWVRQISMNAPRPTDQMLTSRALARVDDVKQFRRNDWNTSVFRATLEVCSVRINTSLVDTTRI